MELEPNCGYFKIAQSNTCQTVNLQIYNIRQNLISFKKNNLQAKATGKYDYGESPNKRPTCIWYTKLVIVKELTIAKFEVLGGKPLLPSFVLKIPK